MLCVCVGWWCPCIVGVVGRGLSGVPAVVCLLCCWLFVGVAGVNVSGGLVVVDAVMLLLAGLVGSVLVPESSLLLDAAAAVVVILFPGG